MARSALLLALAVAELAACDAPRPAAEVAVAPATPSAGAFACPMHPAMTSDDPDARCGVCGMRLVAREGRAGAPATAAASAAGAAPVTGGAVRGIGYVRSVDSGLAHVLVDLHEAMAAGVAAGRPAHLELAAYPGTRFTGTVHAVTTQASPDGRILRVELLVRDDVGRLVAGGYGPVVIVTRP